MQERRRWLSKDASSRVSPWCRRSPAPPPCRCASSPATSVPACRAGCWLGFVLPAFAIMLALTALHSAYGALPAMRDAFLGLGPVVLGDLRRQRLAARPQCHQGPFLYRRRPRRDRGSALSPDRSGRNDPPSLGTGGGAPFAAGWSGFGAVVVALMAAEHFVALLARRPMAAFRPRVGRPGDIGVLFSKSERRPPAAA